MRLQRQKNTYEAVNYDLTISDLMAALVLIFILLLSTQFLELKKQSSLASEYRDKKLALVNALRKEFQDDFVRWKAEFDEQTLMIRFPEDVAFMPESAQLRPRFKAILNDFFPRYISVLTRPEYINEIDEIRIEGHTANPGNKFDTWKGYAESMDLAQGRANNVLFFVLEPFQQQHGDSSEIMNWLRRHIAASGFAFAKPVLKDPKANPLYVESNISWERSRRVEFSIRTKYEEVIQKMIEVTEGKSNARP